MTSPKKRGRARRRVERLMDEAFEALERGERSLADKLSRRATDQGHVNPRIWHDRARIALGCDDLPGADAALRQAIAIAPSYAAAHLDLGRLLASRGRSRAARRAFERALAHAAADVGLRAEVDAAVRALPATEPPDGAPVAPVPSESAHDPIVPIPSTRASRVDIDALERDLLRAGITRLAGYLSDEDTAELIALARPGSGAVEHELEFDSATRRCALRFCRAPLAATLDVLRGELYELLAPIGTEWFARLDRELHLPRAWRQFRPESEPERSAVAFLRLDSDGLFGPERLSPIAGSFPFLVFLVLSCAPTSSIDFELVDLRPGRKCHGVGIRLGQGDVVVSCGEHRQRTIAGVVGLQEVAARVTHRGAEPALTLVMPLVDLH